MKLLLFSDLHCDQQAAVRLVEISADADVMVGAAPFVVREPQLGRQLISVCNEIASVVPVLNLHFRRDDGFWKVIDEHFAALPETAPADSRPGY